MKGAGVANARYSQECNLVDIQVSFDRVAHKSRMGTKKKKKEYFKHRFPEIINHAVIDAGPVQLQPHVANFFFASTFYRGLKIRDWYRCKSKEAAATAKQNHRLFLKGDPEIVRHHRFDPCEHVILC